MTKIFAAADMNGDGDVNATDLGMFLQTPYACAPSGQYDENADINGDGCVNVTDYGILLGLYGQTSIGATLNWDAENRLTAYTPLNPEVGDQKVTFTYDYMGRRVQKQVFDWDLNDPNDGEDDAWATTPATHRKFLWYNWLMIAELDGADDSRVRTYTWGLDLSGNSIESAGGIGGLLAVQDQKVDIGGGQTALRNYITAYDGNGNVTQLVRRNNGDLDAAYEYDAYGNVVASGGLYADQNAMRFSSKYFDDETGFGYWGYRYYSAGMGRWLSRDPIGESGGWHVYEYVGNLPNDDADSLGLRPRRPRRPRRDPPRPRSGPTRPWYDADRDYRLGKDLLWHWFTGGGEYLNINNDPEWSAHMKAHEGLRGQLSPRLSGLASELCKNGEMGDNKVYERFPARLDNGESISAYQFLHGTHARVGDFEIIGTAKRECTADGGCKITFNLNYYWNDIMDPNPEYDTDRWKAAFGGIVTLGQATDYAVRIGWFQKSWIKVGCDGKRIESGWPFDPLIETPD